MQNGLNQIKKFRVKKDMAVGKPNGGMPHCHIDEISREIKNKKNPDHTSAIARLKKIKGQVNGIEKMIEENRYCIDILTQFRAVASALNAVEKTIFERHISSCVRDVVDSKNEAEIQKKIAELTQLIAKRL